MIVPLSKVGVDTSLYGGKAVNLAKLISLGYRVPEGIALPSSIYLEFIETSALDSRIQLELSRRDLENMRWEEIWDAALRIKNIFLRSQIPPTTQELIRHSTSHLSYPLVVRSSSPEEDSADLSFAGLHESVVGVRDFPELIEAMKKVWASLWSDSALLYRKELSLDPHTSSMGVVIQELISGEVSGVAFSRNPADSSESVVIEAVTGLNEQLVDGSADPMRWSVKGNSIALDYRGEFPLDILHEKDISLISDTVKDLESSLGYPVDTEWTLSGGLLYLLQVRPISTMKSSSDTPLWKEKDKRPWYRTLTPTFTSLKELRSEIDSRIIPQMKSAGKDLSSDSLSSMDDRELAREILHRKEIYQMWRDRYWEFLIPFAHGVRLFGSLYNDLIKPEDPYEFIHLLSSDEMISMKRNRRLAELVERINSDSSLVPFLEKGDMTSLPEDFVSLLEEFIGDYSSSVFSGKKVFQEREDFIRLLLSAREGLRDHIPASPTLLEEGFLSAFPPEERDRGRDILALARYSWQLRDNDNIYLGRIESCVLDAVSEGISRLSLPEDTEDSELIERLLGKTIPAKPSSPKKDIQPSPMRTRRLTGQPACEGVGRGRARVIRDKKDLFSFKKGEVLVCDAIDPAMTFIVPLAAAIIERRGGMLIHGAIIAREYGIPCITGIEGATSLISTGDLLVVDGFMGTVSLQDL